jgi:hypothetical protein
MKIGIAIVLATLIVSSASAQTTVLYDPTKGTTPTAQGWIPFANPIGGTSTTNATETTLDTTSNVGIAAGYSNYTTSGAAASTAGTFPVLNSAVGFTLNFTLKLDSATDPNNDRAGFNVILLGSDAKGVELGFWPGDVWAQNAGFVHGTDDAFTTNDKAHQYALTILNGNYTLKADGTQILSGTTLNYGTPNPPYALDNYVFFGDDNVVSSGSEEIGAVSISVPEPTSSILGLGLAGAALVKRNKRR